MDHPHNLTNHPLCPIDHYLVRLTTTWPDHPSCFTDHPFVWLTSVHPPCVTDHPPCPTDHPPGQTDHHLAWPAFPDWPPTLPSWPHTLPDWPPTFPNWLLTLPDWHGRNQWTTIAEISSFTMKWRNVTDVHIGVSVSDAETSSEHAQFLLSFLQPVVRLLHRQAALGVTHQWELWSCTVGYWLLSYTGLKMTVEQG